MRGRLTQGQGSRWLSNDDGATHQTAILILYGYCVSPSADIR